MQVESAAADERARAAEEMRAAAARQIAMSVEIERTGASAEQMRQALDAARATAAEQVAAERHDAMQTSQGGSGPNCAWLSAPSRLMGTRR